MFVCVQLHATQTEVKGIEDRAQNQADRLEKAKAELEKLQQALNEIPQGPPPELDNEKKRLNALVNDKNTQRFSYQQAVSEALDRRRDKERECNDLKGTHHCSP